MKISEFMLKVKDSAKIEDFGIFGYDVTEDAHYYYLTNKIFPYVFKVYKNNRRIIYDRALGREPIAALGFCVTENAMMESLYSIIITGLIEKVPYKENVYNLHPNYENMVIRKN